jgi:hypothetical protein
MKDRIPSKVQDWLSQGGNQQEGITPQEFEFFVSGLSARPGLRQSTEHIMDIWDKMSPFMKVMAMSFIVGGVGASLSGCVGGLSTPDNANSSTSQPGGTEIAPLYPVPDHFIGSAIDAPSTVLAASSDLRQVDPDLSLVNKFTLAAQKQGLHPDHIDVFQLIDGDQDTESRVFADNHLYVETTGEGDSLMIVPPDKGEEGNLIPLRMYKDEETQDIIIGPSFEFTNPDTGEKGFIVTSDIFRLTYDDEGKLISAIYTDPYTGETKSIDPSIVPSGPQPTPSPEPEKVEDTLVDRLLQALSVQEAQAAIESPTPFLPATPTLLVPTDSPTPVITASPTPEVRLTAEDFANLTPDQKQVLWNSAPNELDGLSKSNFSTILPNLILYRDKDGNSQFVLNLLTNEKSSLLEAGIVEFDYVKEEDPSYRAKGELRAFAPDIPVGADAQTIETAEIQAVEETLGYIVKGGVKWGDFRQPRSGEIPKEYLEEFMKTWPGKIENSKAGHSFATGVDVQNSFWLSFSTITYQGRECTIVYYKSSESEYGLKDKSIFVAIPENQVFELIYRGKVTIPPRP